jgi:transcription initiation factor IIF auxiliary subunit
MATERVRVRVSSSFCPFVALASLLTLIVQKGLSIYRPIIYGNTATVLTTKQREALAATSPDHTHTWTVAVRGAASGSDQDIVGGADDLSHFIKRVTFKLHDTYPTPSRSASCSVVRLFRFI